MRFFRQAGSLPTHKTDGSRKRPSFPLYEKGGLIYLVDIRGGKTLV